MSFHDYNRRRGFGSGWSDFVLPDIIVPDNWPNWGDEEVITTDAAGPRTRTESELATAIKAAGGKLNVTGDDSALIVAVNNQLRFSVTNKGNGIYVIEDRLAGGGSSLLLLGGAAVLVLLVAVVGSR